VTGSSKPSDQELLERWRAGDKQAGDVLLRRHVVGLRWYFLTRLNDEDTVKDLVQETMLAVVKGRDEYRGDAPFRGYLFGIASKKYCTELRRRCKEREVIDPLTDSLGDITGRRHSSILTDKDELRRLFDALRGIPIRDQDFLELHYFQDLTAAELAVLERTNTNTAKSLLRLARQKLGRRYQELTGAPPDREIEDNQIHQWLLAGRSSARGESQNSGEA
jgi:RNA polymerase sigma factor (sigma-70 family)